MGFCNASCSFTRFRIIDPIPSELWTQIPDKLRQFAFRDIDDLPEMQAYGWVCFEDMLDSEWRTAPPHKGAYLLFSLRLDTRRIPAAVIKNVSWAEALGINAARGETPAELASAVKEAILK